MVSADVLKALCLGAKAVGLGRAFMYANSVSCFSGSQAHRRLTRRQAYGEAGIVHTVRILQREIVLGMRLLGVTSVKELVPEMVSLLNF